MNGRRRAAWLTGCVLHSGGREDRPVDHVILTHDLAAVYGLCADTKPLVASICRLSGN